MPKNSKALYIQPLTDKAEFSSGNTDEEVLVSDKQKFEVVSVNENNKQRHIVWRAIIDNS